MSVSFPSFVFYCLYVTGGPIRLAGYSYWFCDRHPHPLSHRSGVLVVSRHALARIVRCMPSVVLHIYALRPPRVRRRPWSAPYSAKTGGSHTPREVHRLCRAAAGLAEGQRAPSRPASDNPKTASTTGGSRQNGLHDAEGSRHHCLGRLLDGV